MIANVLIGLIRLYQLTLSRLILATAGPVCRFEPSCSRYAVACLQGHGALRGSLLSLKRLCRCHPFHPGGYDPPPPSPRSAAGAPHDVEGPHRGTSNNVPPDPIGRSTTHEPTAPQNPLALAAF